uniref:EGF-like domain-containing protein n=1 Tax=Branchiostoma floridae TaxID=7739 RepID=C3YZA6_BRAFL|eukprot:XP_002598165.1 hypothetical protein BRAFLDRAFT_123314 [Branchiostoma floridae]
MKPVTACGVLFVLLLVLQLSLARRHPYKKHHRSSAKRGRKTYTNNVYYSPKVIKKLRAQKQIEVGHGLCRYGARYDCCYGWDRNEYGDCKPVCRDACVHGVCTMPGMCTCHTGWRGRTCNKDFNECGHKPRPCQHRCMNSRGSFRCYCNHGYSLQPDGTSCAKSLVCALRKCQFMCREVKKGVPECFCPEGLELGPDGRHCVDVDECSRGLVTCPRRRVCKNTFGSHMCVCAEGLSFKYVDGRLRCTGADVQMTIVVVDPKDTEEPISDSQVRVLSEPKGGGTSVVTTGRTDQNGLLMLTVPSEKPLIIVASKDGFLTNAVTFEALPGQKNIATLRLMVYRETEDVVYNREELTRIFFERRSDLNDASSVIFPPGALLMDDSERATVSFRGVDVSRDRVLQGLPELVGSIEENINQVDFEFEGTSRINLEAYGAAAVDIRAPGNRLVSVSSTFNISIPLAEDLDGTGVMALEGWHFDEDRGVWVQEAIGEIRRVNGRITWEGPVSRTGWWVAGRPWRDASCVRVRVCFDDDCNRPVQNAAIRLAGRDYGYFTQRYTDTDGYTCFNIRRGGTVQLRPCFGAEVVVAGTGQPAVCRRGMGAQWFDPHQRSTGQCKDVMIRISEFDVVDCGVPQLNVGVLQVGDVTGDSSFGANVTYRCDDSSNPYGGHLTRLCHSCGTWSGSPPRCDAYETAFESFALLDAP